MTITIKSISNGYLLINESGETQAFTEGDDDQEIFAKMATSLWHEYLGEPYDKFGSNNIRISFDRKGHKLELE